MGFDEMIKLAESKTGKVNHYCEYEKAYTFEYFFDDDMERDGGFGSPVVIPKGEDACYNFMWAKLSTDLLDGDIIRSGSVKELLAD